MAHSPFPLRSSALALCLGAGLSAVLAPVAAAARRPEVAVVGVHMQGQDASASSLSGNTLAAAFADAAKVDLVDISQLRYRLAGREALVLEAAFLGPGRARLEEGRVLYERADFEPAAEVLAGAVPALEDGSLGTSDIKDLLDALLLLGLARFGLGEPEAAAVPWSRLVELDPNRELDSVNYPPKVVQGFEAVRQKVLAKPMGTLLIDAPEGATVHVDGLKISDRSTKLPAGEHFVVVRAPDGGQQADRVAVRSGDKTVWSAELKTAISGSGDGQAELLYRALGEHLDVDFVLLAGVIEGNQVGMQLYEPRTGSFSKVVSFDAGGDPVSNLTDGMPTLANYISEAGTLRVDRVARKVLPIDLSANAILTELLLNPEPVGEVREVTTKAPWYIWAGVAVVAAGGAAGLTIALLPDDPPPSRSGEGGEDDTTEPPPVNPNQGVILVEIP